MFSKWSHQFYKLQFVLWNLGGLRCHQQIANDWHIGNTATPNADVLGLHFCYFGQLIWQFIVQILL